MRFHANAGKTDPPTLRPCRKRRRTSGFRTRKLTKSGRAILKARRKKGRHVLSPASETGTAGKKH